MIRIVRSKRRARSQASKYQSSPKVNSTWSHAAIGLATGSTGLIRSHSLEVNCCVGVGVTLSSWRFNTFQSVDFEYLQFLCVCEYIEPRSFGKQWPGSLTPCMPTVLCVYQHFGPCARKALLLDKVREQMSNIYNWRLKSKKWWDMVVLVLKLRSPKANQLTEHAHSDVLWYLMDCWTSCHRLAPHACCF